MCGKAVPTRSRPTTPQYTAYVLLKLKETLIGTCKISGWPVHLLHGIERFQRGSDRTYTEEICL